MQWTTWNMESIKLLCTLYSVPLRFVLLCHVAIYAAYIILCLEGAYSKGLDAFLIFILSFWCHWWPWSSARHQQHQMRCTWHDGIRWLPASCSCARIFNAFRFSQLREMDGHKIFRAIPWYSHFVWPEISACLKRGCASFVTGPS